MKELPAEAKRWLAMQARPDRVEPGRIPALQLETGAVCNLGCPFCGTGNGTLKLDGELLTPARFSSILERLPGLKAVALLRQGEPLLNPRLADLLALACAKGLHTTVHSNLSVPGFGRDRARALVRAGLSELNVSCDGASQAVYERYRVGGRLRLVLRNMRLILDEREALGSRTPRVIWQFLVHKANRREMDAAAGMARRLGVEIRFRRLWMEPGLRADWLLEPESAPIEDLLQEYSTCLMAWDQPSVHADGTVFPCCGTSDPEHALGNLLGQPMDQVWNGPRAVAMRRYLRSGERSALELPCYGCPRDPNKRL